MSSCAACGRDDIDSPIGHAFLCGMQHARQAAQIAAMLPVVEAAEAFVDTIGAAPVGGFNVNLRNKTALIRAIVRYREAPA